MSGLILSNTALSTTAGIIVTSVILALLHIIALTIEYILLRSIHANIPELKKRIKKMEPQKRSKCSNIKSIYNGWIVYCHQGLMCLAGFAEAALHLSVLGGDTTTLGYARSQGLSPLAIGLVMGLGGIFAILGAITFTLLHNKIKLELPMVGMVGSIFMVTLLTICFLSIWFPGSPFELASGNGLNQCSIQTTKNHSRNNSTVGYFFLNPCRSYASILSFLISIAVSSFGLVLFYVTIHQLFQEFVEESERGVVGGIQNSLNKVFDLIKYLIVFFVPTMPQFGYIIIIGYGAIFTAYILFTVYTFVVFLCRSS